MRLYLSSRKLGNNPEKLLELLGPNKKHGAIVLNAGEVNKERAERNIKYLMDLGLSSETINLSDYFYKPEALEKKISCFDFLWVKGGNIFKLKQAFEKSGFDKAITKESLNHLVYVGESAGSTITGPSLENLEIVDEIPNDFDSSKEGLKLVEYMVIPHYKSDHPESYLIDKLIEVLNKKGIKYKALRDGEVIIV